MRASNADFMTPDTGLAALETIRAAPRDRAVVAQLCHRPAVGQRAFPLELEMTVRGGIAGDRWRHAPWLRLADGSPDPRIQVSILQERVLKLIWRITGTTLHPGDPIVTDMDLSEANLPVGTQLGVGTAVLEVSDQFNTGCVKWERAYGAASLRWINRPEHRALRLRGILCRIIRGGRVRVGDRIVKLSDGTSA